MATSPPPLIEEKEEAKDRRFIREALSDSPTLELSDALKRYRAKEIDLTSLADHMRGEVYLLGCQAHSELRPEQVGAVLEELERTREGAF